MTAEDVELKGAELGQHPTTIQRHNDTHMTTHDNKSRTHFSTTHHHCFVSFVHPRVFNTVFSPNRVGVLPSRHRPQQTKHQAPLTFLSVSLSSTLPSSTSDTHAQHTTMSHQDFTEITFSKRGVRGAGQGKAAFVNQQKRSGNMTTVKGHGTGGNTSKLAVGGGRNMTTLDNDHTSMSRTFRVRARAPHIDPPLSRARQYPPAATTSRLREPLHERVCGVQGKCLR